MRYTVNSMLDKCIVSICHLRKTFCSRYHCKAWLEIAQMWWGDGSALFFLLFCLMRLKFNYLVGIGHTECARKTVKLMFYIKNGIPKGRNLILGAFY